MCSLQSHQSNIPTEVLDDIIDKLATTQPNSELSSIALVSHSCRDRVNHHRFSTLEIYVHITHFHHLENLASLVCSNLWQQEEGIARHMRSVCLWLGRGNTVPVQSEIRDKIVSSILKTVFDRNGNTYPTRPLAHYT